MKKSILLLCIIALTTLTVSSKEPMKYGKPEASELNMTVYEPDSSASAVVLCNYGYFNANTFQFVHQIRIKILKESGKSYGNFHVPASEKTNVKGLVFNQEGGKTVTTKLNKEGIFIERVSRESYRVRLAMPNVKVGSVIDVEFFYEGVPGYWEFQKTIPIKWSELVLEQSEYISLRKNVTGLVRFNIAEGDRWVASDVPAFKQESYINNYENFLSRMIIELERIHVPGLLYKDYASTWKAVATFLQTNDDFGRQLNDLNFYLNEASGTIKKSNKTDLEKLNAAFQLMKNFKWNKFSTIWPSDGGISYAYNKKTGNSADINMSLIILLRKLDIEAYPVLLSTRDNGFIPPFSVSLEKLNYVVVKAKIGETTYLLDATDENLPIDMLPTRCLNGKGLCVTKDDFYWIDLTPKQKDRKNEYLKCTLQPNGILKGNWNISSSEYAAFDKRESYKSFNSQEEYFKSIESEYPGLSIDSYENKGLDSLTANFSEAFTITFKNRVMLSGDKMYINPYLTERLIENPFKSNERLYPIDFITPIDKKYTLSLTIPDGYTVESTVNNIRFGLPDKSAVIAVNSAINGSEITLTYRFTITKPIYLQNEYLDLKTFFDEAVKKQSEMIVLKKTI